MTKRQKILIRKLEEATGKKVILQENKSNPLLIIRQLYDKYQGLAGLESIILTQEFPFSFLSELRKEPSIQKNIKYQQAVLGLQKQTEAKEFVEALKTVMGVALAKYPMGEQSNIIE